MRILLLACVLVACSSKPDPVPPKRPNNELIVGAYERHAPGTNAFQFTVDGNYVEAKNKGELEHTPHLADGTYKLEKDELTLTADQGQCSDKPDDKTGTYKIVISKIGIRFVKVNDSCEPRSHLDGQTLWRIK
jgi:hypothetical protein